MTWGRTLHISDPQKLRTWLIALLLAILLHIPFFMVPWSQLFPTRDLTGPAPVEIKPIDPATLDAIKKRWQEKSLLLEPKGKTVEQAPDNARYSSDRNVEVEREQKARHKQVIPQPNSAAPPTFTEPRPAIPPQNRSQSKPSSETLPKLSQLGIPFNIGKPQAIPSRDMEQMAASAPQINGGDQAIEEPDLPEGSDNLLNTAESKYFSYYSRLYRAIGPVWQSKVREVPYRQRVPASVYTTQVDVVFDTKGSLVEILYIQTSGVREFDEAVKDAWSRLGQFPNPPKDLVGKDGRVHTAWTFTVHMEGGGPGVRWIPPQ